MKTPILLMVALGVGLIALILWSAQRRHAANKQHEAVEYYGTWDGYRLPLHLIKKITKEEAEARAARGYAYLIGYYDPDGKLIRDVKMLRGSVFFEHIYTYYPSGKLRSVRVTNSDGVVTALGYAESSRPTFKW